MRLDCVHKVDCLLWIYYSSYYAYLDKVVFVKSLLQELKPSTDDVARKESESVRHFVEIGSILERFAQLL